MEKTDRRKLSQETQYELRKQVVRLKKAGNSGLSISEITGLGQVQISRIWKKFQAGGLSAIKVQKRGRRLGEHRLLTSEDESRLRRLMIDNTPDQLGPVDTNRYM